MKAIIQIQKKLSHDNEFSLFTQNLLKLKVCGKELFSYYFDLLNELEVEEIYIIGEEFKNLIDEFYLSKVFSPIIKFIKEKNADEYYLEYFDDFQRDDLLIIKNIGFIFNSSNSVKEKIINQKDNFILRDESFEISYIQQHNKACFLLNELEAFKIKSISTIKDYIYVIDSILHKLDQIDYSLGYSNNEGIVIGKNVKIDKSTKLIPPLLIQDNVKVSNNCTIGPNTIISSNVFIENNTMISNSIICDNTYIGINLNLENKLAIENKIIDKNSLNLYEIDKKLVSINKEFLL